MSSVHQRLGQRVIEGCTTLWAPRPHWLVRRWLVDANRNSLVRRGDDRVAKLDDVDRHAAQHLTGEAFHVEQSEQHVAGRELGLAIPTGESARPLERALRRGASTAAVRRRADRRQPTPARPPCGEQPRGWHRRTAARQRRDCPRPPATPAADARYRLGDGRAGGPHWSPARRHAEQEGSSSRARRHRTTPTLVLDDTPW